MAEEEDKAAAAAEGGGLPPALARRNSLVRQDSAGLGGTEALALQQSQQQLQALGNKVNSLETKLDSVLEILQKSIAFQAASIANLDEVALSEDGAASDTSQNIF